MPLTKSARDFLPEALKVLKREGKLHLYEFMPMESIDDALKSLENDCSEHSRRLKSASAVKCGHCTPALYRVCIDGVIE